MERLWKIPIVSGLHAGDVAEVAGQGGLPPRTIHRQVQQGADRFAVRAYVLKEIRAVLDNSIISIYVYTDERQE